LPLSWRCHCSWTTGLIPTSEMGWGIHRCTWRPAPTMSPSSLHCCEEVRAPRPLGHSQCLESRGFVPQVDEVTDLLASFTSLSLQMQNTEKR
uniref:Uncharacterized protein n=1 Tax=Panthera tigris altaica TaxID=74533 RepID=A0A8C9K643_PANTA